MRRSREKEGEENGGMDGRRRGRRMEGREVRRSREKEGEDKGGQGSEEK